VVPIGSGSSHTFSVDRVEHERGGGAARPWRKDIFLFALHAGMRVGKIRELAWEGADLFRKTVTVFRSKNGERRTIPVNNLVLDSPGAQSEGKVLTGCFQRHL
jgi:integrase